MAVTTFPQPISIEFGKQNLASRQPEHSPRVSTLSFMLGKSNSSSPSSTSASMSHSISSSNTASSASAQKFSLGEGKRLLANCLTFACPKPEKTSTRFHRPLHATPPPNASFLTVDDDDDDDEEDDDDDRDYLHDNEDDDDESDDDAPFNETNDRHDEVFYSD